MNAPTATNGQIVFGAHPLFDALWYLDQNQDVASSGVDPLLHYITQGWREGRNPNPLFDTNWYLRQNPDVSAAGENPLVHYVLFGWREGRAPHPLFDAEWYLKQNPDVAAAEENPLVHYVLFGWREGRAPHPLFDAEWYLKQNLDVATKSQNPLVHYLMVGWRERRDPSPHFNITRYLERHPDVAAENIDPLQHFIEIGKEQERVTKQTAALLKETSTERGENAAGDIYFPIVSNPDISIVIPVYNQLAHTLDCLRSISKQECTYSFEVVVMDDGSTDKTLETLFQIEGIRYFRNDHNLGFIRNCNHGAEFALGKYIVFLNNDTKVLPGWLQALRDTFDHQDKVGIVGSKLIYGDGRLQEAGGIIWEDGTGWNWGRLEDANHPRYNFLRDVDYVSGASLMIAKQLFFELNRFSSALENSYYEDTWLAFAAREAGYRVVYQPKSALIHYEGVTSGRDIVSGAKRYQAVNRHIFVERWAHALRNQLPSDTTPSLASDRLPKGHVLIIDACTPTPDQDSGSLDMFNLIRILLNAGYRVHFIPQTNFVHFGKYTDVLQAMGAECIYAPYYTSVSEYLSEHSEAFSHVIIARLSVADAVFNEVATLAPNAARIFYTVDLHGLREVREAALASDQEKKKSAREALWRELNFIRLSDLTVVLSEYEASYLRERELTNIAMLPLLRDYVRPKNMLSYAERKDVVFIGGFSHNPNIDAVRWLHGEIWPLVQKEAAKGGLPHIKLKIVGSNMPEWIRDWATTDFEPIGFVENLSDVFGAARLSIAPLRYGAGLKGKVATSLGYGVPTIGTSIAFEGMPDQGLDDIRFSADTAADIARELLRLYQDSNRWNAASSAGMDYVAKHYSLQANAPIVEAILAEAKSQRDKQIT